MSAAATMTSPEALHRPARWRSIGVDGLDLVGHIALAAVVVFAAHAVVGPLIAPDAPNQVDLARAYNLTLAGFLKPGSFNVYAGRERIHD